MLQQLPAKLRVTKRRSFPRNITSADDLQKAVKIGMLDCLVPSSPFVTRATNIVTIGSCFAQNIAEYLTERGYKLHRFDVAERLFNPIALADFLENLMKGSNAEAFAAAWQLSEDQIIATRQALSQECVVIVTLGLSLIWEDLETNEVVFDPARKVGAELIHDEPERFIMRQTTVDENVDATSRIIEIVKKFNRSNKIVFTLSPIALRRAVCDYPAVVADCISKSTLRVALHEITMLKLKDVFYFPSFELLRWLTSMVAVIWFEDSQLGHIKKKWIEYALSNFAAAYCVGETSTAPPDFEPTP